MNQNDTRYSLAKRLLAPGLMIMTLALLPGCANKTPGEPLQVASSQYDSGGDAPEKKDYVEPVNRGIFKFNEVVDGLLIRPAAYMYTHAVPEFGQTAIKNVLTNLNAPVTFLNSVLQADGANASRTLTRFVVNSTLGIAGVFDVASTAGIQKEHKKDFGQTLGVYGVGTGSYMVLPILGPSDVRDTFGYVVDIFTDPFNYIFTTDEAFGRAAAQGLVRRADLMPLTDQVHRDSFDPYATFRSIYLQNRQRVIRDYLGSDSNAEKYHGK